MIVNMLQAVVFILLISISKATESSVQALIDASKGGEATALAVGKNGGSCRSSLSLETLRNKTPETEILIFVSFSMPRDSLKGLYEGAQKVGGRLILRGLVNDSFRETMEKAKEIGIVVDVDPPIFSEYRMTAVPALVLKKQGRSDHIYGNIPVIDSLWLIASSGDLRDEAESYIKRLERG